MQTEVKQGDVRLIANDQLQHEISIPHNKSVITVQ